MNKAELIERLAKENILTKVESERVVNIVVDAIEKSLKQGEEVKISGFGKWFVSKRQGRLVKNPQTGEKIKIPAFNIPAFRPGKNLRQALR